MQKFKTHLEKENLPSEVQSLQNTEASVKDSCEEASMAVDVPIEEFLEGTGKCECHVEMLPVILITQIQGEWAWSRMGSQRMFWETNRSSEETGTVCLT